MTSCTQTKHDWKMVKYTARTIFLCTLFVCKVCVQSLIWPLYIDCQEVLCYNSLTSNATLLWYTNRKGHQYLSTLCVDLAKDQTSSMACFWACLLQQLHSDPKQYDTYTHEIQRYTWPWSWVSEIIQIAYGKQNSLGSSV